MNDFNGQVTPKFCSDLGLVVLQHLRAYYERLHVCMMFYMRCDGRREVEFQFYFSYQTTRTLFVAVFRRFRSDVNVSERLMNTC